jgi:hypothetical protein
MAMYLKVEVSIDSNDDINRCVDVLLHIMRTNKCPLMFENFRGSTYHIERVNTRQEIFQIIGDSLE